MAASASRPRSSTRPAVPAARRHGDPQQRVLGRHPPGPEQQFRFELGTGLEAPTTPPLLAGSDATENTVGGRRRGAGDRTRPREWAALGDRLPHPFRPSPRDGGVREHEPIRRHGAETADDVADLILGPMLRDIGPTWATIWVETDAPCTVEVLGHRARTFTVAGHYYALVIVEGLAPGRRRYDVRLDGERRWPLRRSQFPPSAIRTGDGGECACCSARVARPPRTSRRGPWRCISTRPAAVSTPSCPRAAHDRSIDREVAAHRRDARRSGLRRRLVTRDAQAYREPTRGRDPVEGCRSSRRRLRGVLLAVPRVVVARVERWFFSVVPTAMMFDDHDMIDDWNISDSWVGDIRGSRGGTSTSSAVWSRTGSTSISGTSAPARSAPRACSRSWASSTTASSTCATGRGIRGVHAGAGRLPVLVRPPVRRRRLVVIDARNGRVLEPGKRVVRRRRRVGVDRRQCRPPTSDHLLIGTSLPTFVPGGLHDLHGGTSGSATARGVDSASVSASGSARSTSRTGRRSGVRSTRWCAARRGRQRRPTHARGTISVLSGDIHFSYHLGTPLPRCPAHVISHVHQVVNSPYPQRAAAVRARRDASRDVAGGHAVRARAAAGDGGSSPQAPTGTSTTGRSSTTVLASSPSTAMRQRFAWSGRRPTMTAPSVSRSCSKSISTAVSADWGRHAGFRSGKDGVTNGGGKSTLRWIDARTTVGPLPSARPARATAGHMADPVAGHRSSVWRAMWY